MNLTKKNLHFAFVSCFLLTILIPVIIPSLRLMFLVPFLVLLFYQKSYPYCLWIAFFSGLFIDLLSLQSPFGFYACIYTLTTAILYSQKRNFFADHLSTLPIMTFFYSFTATMLEVVFLYIFGKSGTLSFYWVFTDLIFMPTSDALFAFLWFILIPMSLRKKPKRRTI